MTTDSIVIQKNAPGHSDELSMASATVMMNTVTSVRMLNTMRFVMSPLL